MVVPKSITSPSEGLGELKNDRLKTNIIKNPGYVKGYEKEYSEAKIDYRTKHNLLDVEQMGYDNTGAQKMRDYTSNKFRYGLDDTTGLYWLDDPILMSFNIILDGESPLFNKKYLSQFLEDYSDLPEIKYRISLHKEFLYRLSRIFKINPNYNAYSNNNDDDIEPRGYYINKIDGLDNFMKKMIKYKDDKLSIDISEDVTMRSFYLAELYNNLMYSYKSQRYNAPENLFRFNMKIIIKEFRNYVIPANDLDNMFGQNSLKNYMKSKGVGDGQVTDIFSAALRNAEIKQSKTELYNLQRTKYSFIESPTSIYEVTLHDCNFDFTTSKITKEHITQAGLSSPVPTDYSWLTFDIFYKSIRRKLITDLLNDSFIIDNRSSNLEDSKDLNLTQLRGIDRRGIDTSDNSIYDDNKSKFFQDNNRGGLINQLLSDVKSTVNLKRIGFSLADNVIGEQNRLLIMDGLNGINGKGNYDLLKNTARNIVTTHIDKYRRIGMLKFNDLVNNIKGNKWEEDILDGKGELNDKNKFKIPESLYEESGKSNNRLNNPPESLYDNDE